MEAATRATTCDCFRLPVWFANGKCGFPEDAKQTAKWYRKTVECKMYKTTTTNT